MNNAIVKDFEEFFKELSSFIYDLHSNREKINAPMSETVYPNSILKEINKSQATSGQSQTAVNNSKGNMTTAAVNFLQSLSASQKQ